MALKKLFLFLSCSHLILSKKKPGCSEFWLPFRSVVFFLSCPGGVKEKMSWLLVPLLSLIFYQNVLCQTHHRIVHGFCSDDLVKQHCRHHVLLCGFSPCKFYFLFWIFTILTLWKKIPGVLYLSKKTGEVLLTASRTNPF